MELLRRVYGVTLLDQMRSTKIGKSLNVEPILLRIERSQQGWFGHVARMLQERLANQVMLATPNGKRPMG